MKRISFLALVSVFCILPVFSYSPAIVPDKAALPAILDSSYHIKLDPNNPVFGSYHREIYTYDEHGNRIEEIYYYRDFESDDWTANKREVYLFDGNGNIVEQVHFYWDVVINNWRGTNKYLAYWSKLVTSNDTRPKDQKHLIYPNPLSDLLRIELSKHEKHNITIRSLNGQMVYHNIMEGSNFQIDISSLQKGLYFISIRSGSSNWTEKLIKL